MNGRPSKLHFNSSAFTTAFRLFDEVTDNPPRTIFLSNHRHSLSGSGLFLIGRVEVKTTYSPSGAPGSVVAVVALFRVRDLNPPNGLRAVFAAACHLSDGTAFLKNVAAVSQL
jgi:hypothetical protein